MRLALLALLTVVLAAPAIAQTQGVHRITRVTDRLWVAEPRFGGANASIIAEDGYTVLVDPHSDPATARALAEEALAITQQPIRYVINTHWHGDHHGGNRALAELYPDQVTFIAHPNTKRDIVDEATPELRRMGGFYATFADKAEAALAAGSFQDGAPISAQQRDQIAAYARELRAFVESSGEYEYHLPELSVDSRITLGDLEILYIGLWAHTEGDLVVRLRDANIMIVGDLLTAPYVVPRSGYPRAYAETIRQLIARNPSAYVLGHGGPVKRGHAFAETMADFLDAVSDWAEKHPVGPAEDAVNDAAIAAFEDRINWEEPGLTFLDFPGLVAMTLSRARIEIGD